MSSFSGGAMSGRVERIACCIHSLAGGGAERVLVRLMQHWVDQGRHVTLITLGVPADDRYELDPRVERVFLDELQPSRGLFSAVRNNWRRVRRLRRALEAARCERIVSFTAPMNILVLLAARRASRRVVIAERVDPRRQPLGRAWRYLRGSVYPRCLAAVVQTASVRSYVQELVKQRPVWVIPNPAPAATARAAEPTAATTADIASQRPYVLACGRLDGQKGFDLLIDAFARVAPGQPAWRLVIVGEGSERAALVEQIARRELTDRVRLVGWRDDLPAWLAGAGLFALPSRWEGFPNVLLEALAAGCACLAADCDSGPRDILRHDENGWLVEPEDVAAWTAALDRLLADEPLRRRLAAHAAAALERFSPERVFAQWDALLDTPAGSPRDMPPAEPRCGPPAPHP